MSSTSKAKGVKNVQRRTWDTAVYEAKAAARRQQQEEEEGPPPQEVSETTKPEFQAAAAGAAGPQGSQRAYLKARKRKIDGLDDQVGQTTLLSVEEAAGSSSDGVRKTGVGWQCTVCNCFLKDSNSYLDHINGRKHQKKLGFSMRVERSSHESVLERLNALKQQKKQASQQEQEMINFHERVKEKDEQEKLRQQERQRKRKERRQKAKQPQSSKEDDNEATENDNDQPEEEEEEEEEEAAIDPNLAAMMGFSGFGGSSKN